MDSRSGSQFGDAECERCRQSAHDTVSIRGLGVTLLAGPGNMNHLADDSCEFLTTVDRNAQIR
jgi:hypothetical protein